MTLQTREVRRDTDPNDGSTMIVSYIYDDVDLRIREFDADNQTTHDYTVIAHAIAADRTVTKLCPAHTLTTQTVGTGVAQRLQLFVNSAGKLDGVEWTIF